MADAPYDSGSDSDSPIRTSGSKPIPRRPTMAPLPEPDVGPLAVDPALIPKAGGRPRKEKQPASSAAALESSDEDKKSRDQEIAQAKIQAALGQAMLQAAAQRRAEMAAAAASRGKPKVIEVSNPAVDPALLPHGGSQGDYYTEGEILYLLGFGVVTGIAACMIGYKVYNWAFAAESASKVIYKTAGKASSVKPL